MPTAKPKVAVTCVMCGTVFRVHASRAKRTGSLAPKYCGGPCAWQGQKLNRTIWSSGLTKETDPRLANIARRVSEQYRRDPSFRRGENHPFYGRSHTDDANERNRAAHLGTTANEAQRAGLAVGWYHRKGQTKETLESIARGAAQISAIQKGRKNPEHAAWARRFYAENPDKHPNRILAKRGHETGIERTMRLALDQAGIAYEPQHPAGRHFIDFALVGPMIAVEVDGAYWHTPERDAERDASLGALGWAVLHFTEDRVKRDIHGCITELLQAAEYASKLIGKLG
jgi:very-short-patch-repair endonuclease